MALFDEIMRIYSILQGRKMLESWKEANTALRPKKGEDLTLRRN